MSYTQVGRLRREPPDPALSKHEWMKPEYYLAALYRLANVVSTTQWRDVCTRSQILRHFVCGYPFTESGRPAGLAELASVSTQSAGAFMVRVRVVLGRSFLRSGGGRLRRRSLSDSERLQHPVDGIAFRARPTRVVREGKLAPHAGDVSPVANGYDKPWLLPRWRHTGRASSPTFLDNGSAAQGGRTHSPRRHGRSSRAATG